MVGFVSRYQGLCFGLGQAGNKSALWLAAFVLLSAGLGACSDSSDKTQNGNNSLPDTTFGPETLFGTDASVLETLSATDGVIQDSKEVSSCEFSAFPSPGEPGAACVLAADCNTGLCIDTADGKICSRPCQDCCPSSYTCKQISTAAETQFVCAPRFAVLCQPCLTDSECQATDAGSLCIERPGQGRFCGGACASDTDCPMDYTCTASQGEKGFGKQCVLAGQGECPCSEKAIFAGATTSCTTSNDAGSCHGQRKCTATGLSGCDAKVPAAESCNDQDDNCNGQTDELGSTGCTTWFTDADNDGFGGTAAACTCKPVGLATSATGSDCNDGNKFAYPGAPESCNNLDDDCDGASDEGCDGDGDGWCNTGKVGGLLLNVCTNGLGDCNDNKADIKPGQPDICGNGVDDDCDGQTDTGNNVSKCTTYYADGDKDNYGGGQSACLCAPTPAFPATSALDCNDAAVGISPAATESCNNQDDDCDGQTDEGCDGDGDGWCNTAKVGGVQLAVCSKGLGDCNDADSAIYPGQPDLCGNGVDDNCDGQTDAGSNVSGCSSYYADGDTDGYGIGTGSCLCGPTTAFPVANKLDCNDGTASVSPAVAEACNGIDDDCDSQIDEGCDGDGDGYCDASSGGGVSTLVCPKGPGDCNDKNGKVNPGQEEICGNGVDDDCNGATDFGVNPLGCEPFYADNDSDGFGAGTSVCQCKASGAYPATKGGDCNDNAIGINSAATETCNTLDDNCNGLIDETGAAGCSLYYTDADEDGYSNGAESSCLCGPYSSYVTKLTGDCNDQVFASNPGATESCNGADDDCDGNTDEVDASGCTVYFADNDNDLFGGASQCLCAKDASYKLTVGGDCNDFDDAIAPETQEYCDGIDEDCDGLTDEEDSFGCDLYYNDNDSDGFGDSALSYRCLCAAQGSWKVLAAGDCNDEDKDVNPAGTETCNGKDDDCDLNLDPANSGGCLTFYRDNDGDAYGTTQSQCLCGATPPYSASNADDCNDGLKLINPAGTETCNGLDDNCNGESDEGMLGTVWPDNDGDGYGATFGSIQACGVPAGYSAASGDCNDGLIGTNPLAPEACDGADNNCNNLIDEGLSPPTWYLDGDGDGYGKPGTATAQCLNPGGYVTNADDCNDASGAIKPGATEVCNGIDDNCAGGIDNGLAFSTYYEDKDLDTYGNAAVTKSACSQPSGHVANNTDCNDNSNVIKPTQAETCDFVDQDCDGSTDEGLSTSTYYFDGDGDGYGVASPTKVACAKPAGYATNKNDCNDNASSSYPDSGLIPFASLNESLGGCNGIDNNCDGYTDEGFAWPYYKDGDGDGFGLSTNSISVCIGSSPPATYVRDGADCDDANAARYPGAAEVPNDTVDQDCYGGDLVSKGSCTAVTISQFETGPWAFTMGGGWTWDYYYSFNPFGSSTKTRRLAYQNDKQTGYPAAASPGSTTSAVIGVPDKTVSIQFDLQFDNSTGLDANDDEIPDAAAYVEARIAGGTWAKIGPFGTYQGSKKTMKVPVSSGLWLTSQLFEIRVVASKSTDSYQGFFIDNLQAVCN